MSPEPRCREANDVFSPGMWWFKLNENQDLNHSITANYFN